MKCSARACYAAEVLIKSDECLPALRALADPTRLKIVEIVLAGDHNVNALAERAAGGAASFARGLNDTPKIAALLLVAYTLDVRWSIALVAVVMALGGLIDARNAGETLGKKVTDMNPGEGFAANVATALLVSTASYHSLPVSTTHVSVGSLVGIGLVTGKGHWPNVGQIVLSWLVTLPCGAALAALTAFALRALMGA